MKKRYRYFISYKASNGSYGDLFLVATHKIRSMVQLRVSKGLIKKTHGLKDCSIIITNYKLM